MNLTPLQKQMAEALSADYEALYRPIDKVCDACGEKHTGSSTTCSRCANRDESFPGR